MGVVEKSQCDEQNKTNYLASQIDMGGCRQNASKLSSNNCVVNS